MREKGLTSLERSHRDTCGQKGPVEEVHHLHGMDRSQTLVRIPGSRMPRQGCYVLLVLEKVTQSIRERLRPLNLNNRHVQRVELQKPSTAVILGEEQMADCIVRVRRVRF